MFKNPFSFEGRIRRLEYGLTALMYWVLMILVQVLGETAPFLFLIILPAIWVMLAQGCKRCHDVGKNGFWQIIPFYSLILIFQQGDPEMNEYGFPPLRSGEMNKRSLESEIQSIGEKPE
ncbi:DUF805 domain-containing protein [Chitinophaga sp.]|uniref:DUF805 domain-containing protein n=1 Tax=Chitinophaga sp. TaxID=1869181 RepID=UPI0031D635F6